MLVYRDKIIRYITDWLSGQLLADNKQSLVCVVSGGVDSCVSARLCLNTSAKKVFMIFMGFKEDEEESFRNYLSNIKTNKYEIIIPNHPELSISHGVADENKLSLIPAYVDSIARNNNSITVGAINKSEYEFVKFFRKRVDTIFDVYPIIDLYRSEIIELGVHFGLPENITSSKSITEKSFGFTYDELEWLSREDNNINIVSGLKDPSTAKYWALYNTRNKELVKAVYKMSKLNSSKKISDYQQCKVRTSLPGLIK